MEINRLRSIIRESISNNLKEIEDVAENAAMEAKLNAYTEAIEKVNKKIEMAESLEEMQELVDPTKLNELKKHLKTLEKSKEKLEKVKAKKNKGKEVVTDEPVEEAEVEEGDKYNPENSWNDAEVHDPFNEKTPYQPMDEEEAINESFLKMQKLAGVITEAQYNQKKSLIENQLEEISLSGALNKVKDKIASLPAFDKLINSVVAKMSEKDKENFKAKFNLNEAKGVPSLEDIMAKVDAINPNKDAKTPEDLKEGAEETVDKIAYEVVRLVRNLTGINLLALGGIPFGFVINYLIDMSPWSFGAFVGPVISLIASFIINGIATKLIGDDEIVAESEDQQEAPTPEKIAKDIANNIDQLKSNPKLKAIADKIAADPKATEELNKILAKFNISLNEGDIDVNPQDVYKIALAFAKKAKTLGEEEGNYGALFLGGLFGGGALARYIASLGDIITPEMKMLGYSPSHMTAAVLGGLAAAALLMIGQYIYDNYKK
jgi:hypothetical protein